MYLCYISDNVDKVTMRSHKCQIKNHDKRNVSPNMEQQVTVNDNIQKTAKSLPPMHPPIPLLTPNSVLQLSSLSSLSCTGPDMT